MSKLPPEVLTVYPDGAVYWKRKRLGTIPALGKLLAAQSGGRPTRFFGQAVFERLEVPGRGRLPANLKGRKKGSAGAPEVPSREVLRVTSSACTVQGKKLGAQETLAALTRWAQETEAVQQQCYVKGNRPC